MESTYLYLGLSGMLTVLLWVPYIVARLFVWGLPTFINNYPEGFPKNNPEPPLWAQRAQRAHLNMIETLPAFVAVVVASGLLADPSSYQTISQCSQIFFYSRIMHAAVYITAIPYLRTPVYLVSWVAILVIGAQTF